MGSEVVWLLCHLVPFPFAPPHPDCPGRPLVRALTSPPPHPSANPTHCDTQQPTPTPSHTPVPRPLPQVEDVTAKGAKEEG